MNAREWREIGERLKRQAAEIRQAFQDAVAIEDVAIDDALPEAADPFRRIRVALGFLRD